MINTTQRGALAGALATACFCIWTANAATNNATPAPAVTTATNAVPKDAGLFPDPVVVKAKGFEIKRSALDESVIGIKAEAAARGQPIPDEMKANLEWDVLHDLIFRKILASKATSEDKVKAQEDFDKFFVELRKHFPTDSELGAQLKAIGKTVDQFKQEKLEEETCSAVLDRDLKSKVTVADADIKKIYDDNPSEFEHPERARVSHILFMTSDKEQGPLPDDKKKEKEKLARDIKARADKGEDFAALAKQYSEDTFSKDAGGALDPISRGDTLPEFEAAAFSLKTNQISDIVETKFGYHIIKLWEKIPASKDTLEKVTPQIKDYLVHQEVVKRIPDYRTQLEKDAGVEIIGIKEPPKLNGDAQDLAIPSDKKPASAPTPAPATNK